MCDGVSSTGTKALHGAAQLGGAASAPSRRELTQNAPGAVAAPGGKDAAAAAADRPSRM
jgi:hypothetical protein